jgi:glycosyltransferase involved in cell wall biosynthesis
MARVTMLLDNDFERDHRVLKEARSLVGAGHEVLVVALLTPGSAEEETRDGLRVERVPPPAFSGRRGIAQLPEKLRWYARMAPLGRRAAEHPADVVHAHDLTTLGPARRAAAKLGAALIYDDHELYVETLNTTYPLDRGPLRRLAYRAMESYLRLVGTRLERRCLRDVAGHVTVSDTIADELVRRYGCPRPVVVANCPPLRDPPEPDGRLRRALGAADGTRVVLYQGTFPASGAGQEDLVDAAARLPDDVRIAFLGWGFGQTMLERRARERGVADRVAFLPPVPPDELPHWIADADLAAVPNRPVNLSNLLALPNKLFETMMAGVPVVAADTPEVRRVLETYPAGVLYEMGDVGGLADRVLEVLAAGEEGRDAFRVAARRATVETYCWERQAERLLGVYEKVLEAACTRKS